MALSVTLFRDFVEDQRISMEVYADSLRNAFRKHYPGCFEYNEYVPPFPNWLTHSPSSMRFARYGIYPVKARNNQGTINHIVDQGYGHLLYCLDPNKTVVTVHDLIPLLRWRGFINGLIRGRKPWLNLISFIALRRAAHLISDSENTRQDLIRFCDCNPKKISVIPLGLDPSFRLYNTEEKQSASRSLGLHKGDFKRILVIGSQVYKNNSGALSAVEKLCKLYTQPIQLIKVGPVTAEWNRMSEQTGLKEKIIYLNLNRTQLPDLYNSVDCLLAPSFYEGFGWPPLEAMACGVPVVTSNAGSLPEVIGDAGLQCSPLDINNLAQAMYLLITNDTLRKIYIQRGFAHAKRYTWQETARKTIQIYEGINFI